MSGFWCDGEWRRKELISTVGRWLNSAIGLQGISLDSSRGVDCFGWAAKAMNVSAEDFPAFACWSDQIGL
ncbi:hypothetical protein Tcur_0178 [Thermomonospora curvata DSM 43183]|uniref:Uncharacterized protein n=1 Tax=Thermomonospora curvata (strain ATCC 19995 / DSM 43183 / JCM 3096 / KCTC 9072 / NBRC 15933 / NCIMB 10081 / Henssen B9) TaxID=471852 RepID=D1AEG7_THECD|nr:hypothetical protein Tcur_0178 [Thermomonospora curvata DSM 43183]